MALLETSLRFYGTFIRTQSRGAYFVHVQSARSSMVFKNVPGDPTATNEDVIALLRRCWRLYCVYLGVLYYMYLRTQRDRREDAAPVCQGFKLNGFAVNGWVILIAWILIFFRMQIA